ncbi:MAG: hypothetical protein SXQ77_11835 [Halobacteria archaeon]|nr:hypothetical protein [Halobacteria archaeon]
MTKSVGDYEPTERLNWLAKVSLLTVFVLGLFVFKATRNGESVGVELVLQGFIFSMTTSVVLVISYQFWMYLARKMEEKIRRFFPELDDVRECPECGEFLLGGDIRREGECLNCGTTLYSGFITRVLTSKKGYRLGRHARRKLRKVAAVSAVLGIVLTGSAWAMLGVPVPPYAVVPVVQVDSFVGSLDTSRATSGVQGAQNINETKLEQYMRQEIENRTANGTGSRTDESQKFDPYEMNTSEVSELFDERIEVTGVNIDNSGESLSAGYGCDSDNPKATNFNVTLDNESNVVGKTATRKVAGKLVDKWMELGKKGMNGNENGGITADSLMDSIGVSITKQSEKIKVSTVFC